MHQQRVNKYNKYVVAEDFLLVSNYSTVMQLPIFLRAVISTTSKEYLTEKRQSINALAACFLLSGQRSITTKAKKSIAGFKLREGALIGCRATLRKKRLYTIIDKLLTFALPRIFSQDREHAPFKIRRSQFSLTRSLNTPIYNYTLQGLQKEYVKDKKVLAQKERTLLIRHLQALKQDKIRYKVKNRERVTEADTSHLAFGIKDLLLVPELQEFLQLFDTIRGLNIGISFFNTSIKESRFPLTLLPLTQAGNIVKPSTPQKYLLGHTNTPSKEQNSTLKRDGYRGILDSNKKAHIPSPYKTEEDKEIRDKLLLPSYGRAIKDYSIKLSNLRVVDTGLQRSTYTEDVIKTPPRLIEEMASTSKNKKEKDRLESESRENSQQEGVASRETRLLFDNQRKLSKKKETFLKEIKWSFLQRQSKRERVARYISCTLRDTPLLKRNRRELFLTCFQYPKQYN